MIVMLLAYSCKQDELCYDHRHYPYVRVNVDLTSTGLSFSQLQSYSVIFYPYDDGIISLEDLTGDIQKFRIQQDYQFTIQVKPGLYNVLLYSDYTGQVAFNSIYDYDEISAYAITSKFLSYVRSDTSVVGGVESVIPMPEPVVVGRVDKFAVDNVGEDITQIKDINFSGELATSYFNVEFWVKNSNSMSGLKAYVGTTNNRYYISQHRGASDGVYDMYVGEDGDRSDIDGRTVISYEKYYEAYPVDPEDEDDVDTYANYYNFREYKISGCTFGFTALNEDSGSDQSVATRDGGDVSDTTLDRYIYFAVTLKTGEVIISDLYELDSSKLKAGETIVIGSIDDVAMELPELISDDEDPDGGFQPGVGSWDEEVVVGPYELE